MEYRATMSIQFADHQQPVATAKQGYLELGYVQTRVLSAIRAKCIDCSGGSALEVKLCRSVRCALFPFRLGSNPWRKESAPREISDEQRAALTERLRAGRLSKAALSEAAE
jgi:hypothetical protein